MSGGSEKDFEGSKPGAFNRHLRECVCFVLIFIASLMCSSSFSLAV